MSFTVDWSENRERWPELLGRFAGKPDLRFLEIGCFEGAATVWLLQHVLTDDSSGIDVIDTFEGQPYWGDYLKGFKDRFLENVAPFGERVKVYEGRSDKILPTLTGPYDFIYVDGSHIAANVLNDAVVSWPLLRKGGMVIFDDYIWATDQPEQDHPSRGVDAFLAAYDEQLTVVSKGAQVAVEKL